MIELPKFDTFNKDEIAIFPQINNPSAVTIAEIKVEYPQLGRIIIDAETGDTEPNRWVEGVQEALPDKTIVSRTYNRLQFDEDAFDFDFITGGDAIDFGSSTYWRVLHRFTEEEFFSNNSDQLQNFQIWELSYHRYQQEIIYLHEELNSLEWNRTKISVPPVTVPPPIGSPIGTPGTQACPTLPPPTAPAGQTGESAVFVDGTDLTGAPLCSRWASIPLDFLLVFNVGEALGGYIETDASGYNIYLSENPPTLDGSGNLVFNGFSQQVSNGSVNNPIKYSYTYISFYMSDNAGFTPPTRTSPTFVRLKRYGVENFRLSLPFERDNEPEILHHTPDTPRLPRAAAGVPTMYKPPGNFNFPDDFWNDADITTLFGFGNRLGSGGSVSLG